MANENNALVFGEDDMILPDDFPTDGSEYRFESDEITEPEVNEEPAEVSATTDDVVPTTEQTVTETNVAEEQTDIPPTTEEVAAPIPATVKVKYNHEERELSLDEAAVLAQKGMNYDKLNERLNGYEAMRNRNTMLAKRLGYETEEEMIAAAETNFKNRKIKELVDAGNTEAMAKFLVEQEMAKADQLARTSVAPQVQPTPEAKPSNGLSPERRAELDAFVRMFPGVTKLPDEVIAQNRAGVPLSLAYERYQNKLASQSKDKELAILKQNQAAAAKAPVVGVTGTIAPAAEKPVDPFVQGFDNDENWYQ